MHNIKSTVYGRIFLFLFSTISFLPSSQGADQTEPEEISYQETKDFFESYVESKSDSAITYMKSGIKQVLQREIKEDYCFWANGGGNLITKYADNEQGLRVCELCLESISEQDSLYSTYLYKIALFHLKMNNYNLAEEKLKECIERVEKTSDKKFLSKLYMYLAYLYEDMELMERATESLLKSLEIAEETEDALSQASVCNNIAALYYNLNNINTALEYANRAYSYIDDTLSVVYLSILQTHGAILSKTPKAELSHALFSRVAALGKEIKDTFSVSNAYANLAALSNEFGTFENTLNHLDSLDKYLSTSDDTYYYYINLAEALTGLGRCKDAKNAIDRVQNLIPAYDGTEYRATAEYYRVKLSVDICFSGRDSTLLFAENSLAYLDSTYTQLQNRETMRLESQYKARIRQDSIAALKVLQAEQEQTLNNKNILLGLTFALLGFMVLAFILVRRNQRNQKLLNTLKEENYRRQSEFFVNVAHELKTPLSVIDGMSDLILKENSLPTQTVNRLQLIRRNSSKLLRSTHQLLEIARDEVKEEKAVIDTFSLQDLCKELKDDFALQVEHKNIDFSIRGEIKEGQNIQTDKEKLQTILRNLLDNAIKYSSSGDKVNLTYRIEGENRFIAKIRDTGKGIPADKLSYLFERFYRTEEKTPQGGFGIGLAMVKKYTDLLKGTIEVTSTPGQGSVFTLNIPVVLTAIETKPLSTTTEDKSAAAPIQGEMPSDRQKILIAEDSSDYCLYLKAVLEEYYELFFVENGEKALIFLAENKVDLVITDWMMPGLDGAELTRAVKQQAEFSDLPFLMLTARALKGDRIRALRIGVDDYLQKDSTEEVLRQRVEALLESKTEREDMRRLYHEEDILNLFEKDDRWLFTLEESVLSMLSDFDLSVEKIAESLDISSQKLSRKIKLLTGITAKKYIQEIRFWEARKLLETGTYDTVKAVCLTVGFRDWKHFSRNFKKRFNVYPSELLKQ